MATGTVCAAERADRGRKVCAAKGGLLLLCLVFEPVLHTPVSTKADCFEFVRRP
jgi:hypothetical protein